MSKENANKEITKVNKEREKHYKFYTNRNWRDMNNYDLIMNVDSKGVEKTAKFIKECVTE